MLARGALSLASLLKSMPGAGRRWAGTAGGKLLASATAGAASGLTKYAAMQPWARRAIAGGVLGGAYGAVSDDTSIIGGALMGASIGAASAPIGRGLGRGIANYRELRALGAPRPFATGGTARVMVDDARSYIGNTYTRAANGFRALRQRYF